MRKTSLLCSTAQFFWTTQDGLGSDFVETNERCTSCLTTVEVPVTLDACCQGGLRLGHEQEKIFLLYFLLRTGGTVVTFVASWFYRVSC